MAYPKISSLSIVIPALNEEGNLVILYKEIKKELRNLSIRSEIIIVNDGSTDNTEKILDDLSVNDSDLKVIHLSRKYGQTAALAAGIDVATGEVIIPMDADLQNDPIDIPRFLDGIENGGYDVISGWRKNRQDDFIRRLPSMIANKLISYITGVKLHDYGCTMKAYRNHVIKNIRFYGEMHRFIPAYALWHGAKISEIIVNHRPRIHGLSKYGISRTFRVILDLLTVKFIMSYLTKPIHFFGSIGLMALFLSFVSGFASIALRLFYDIHFIRTPLPLLSTFFALTGLQFILMGILAEILIRVYHEPQGRSTYLVRRKNNL